MSIVTKAKNLWKKVPPLAKLGLCVTGVIAAGAGIVAAATGAAFGTVALLATGALAGAVGGAVLGACLGIFPSIGYAHIVNRRNGDGWQSTPAFLTGLAISATIGAGIGAWRGYVMTQNKIDELAPAKTEFNVKAPRPSAFVPAPAPKNTYVLKFA